MNFKTKKPAFEYLKNQWLKRHRKLQDDLWDKHGEQLNRLARTLPARQLLVGGLGGIMMLATPAVGLLSSSHILPKTIGSLGDEVIGEEDKNRELVNKLPVPEEVRSLSPEEEEEIAEILSQNFDINVKPEIEGKRLNRTYGFIGGEQHLYRYPGDNLFKHADNASDWIMYGPAGIAPHLGAWGYFVPSQEEFTEKDKMKEKYYLAVQTFLSPGFAERVEEYRDFFKFRKMLVVNPKTGQAVVVIIGDAGPAVWTGKHLGGSPEVMHYLGLATGSRKGPVLYFFIDDPEDMVPLGPVKVKENFET